MYNSLNGRIVKKEEAYISFSSEAYLYGYGLFETLKVHRGQAFFLEDHLKRLIKGCQILGLEWKHSIEEIQEYCQHIIEKNNLLQGVVRISYSKNGEENHLLITTKESTYSAEVYARGFKVCFSQIRRNPHSLLVGIKSNNYLENLLAFTDAKTRGYDETFFLNIYDQLSEGAISNVFFVKDEVIYTPSTDCGILPGIMRAKVMELLIKGGFKLITGDFSQEELLGADEIFITNSLLNIMPVAQIEDRTMDLHENFVTRNVQKMMIELYK